jgi:hypothetical protein
VNQRASGPLPAFVLIIAAVAGLIGLLRSGYLLSKGSVYQLLGRETEAVVESVESYEALKRKPRPSSRFTCFRGAYGFDLQTPGTGPRHLTGRFDTGRSVGFQGESLRVGDRIPVIYLRFDPSRSRPAWEGGPWDWIIPAVVFAGSVFLLGLCCVIFRLRTWGLPGKEPVSKKWRK